MSPPRTGAKEFAEITIHKKEHQHMQGLGQPQTASETEFIVESRKLDQATEQLRELLTNLNTRTELVRVSIATPEAPNLKDPRPEPQLSSMGHFLRGQREKIRDACRLLETILSEIRI